MKKKQYTLYVKTLSIIIGCFIYAPNCAYPVQNNKAAIRVPAGQGDTFKRIEISIGKILQQTVFPDSISRRLLSNIGIKKIYERTGKSTIEIDLSWTGINDTIVINFIKRNGNNKPAYIKVQKEHGLIEYTVPEDITISELRDLVRDIDSLAGDSPNRLELSDFFSQRFKSAAVYLAREIAWDKITDPKQSQTVKGQIELLYLLGDIFAGISNTSTGFQEIRKSSQELDNKVAEQYLRTNLNIGPDTLTNPDALNQWCNTNMYLICQEARSVVMSQLEAVIFKKGSEKLYKNLTDRYSLFHRIIRLLKGLFAETPEELLKDTIPIEKWKEQLRTTSSPTQEVKILKKVAKIVERYHGWVNEDGLDFSSAYSLRTKELNCLTRTTLIYRILKELGIKENRIYQASHRGHSFLIVELRGKSYCAVQTLRENSSKHTKPIKTIPNGQISDRLKTQISINIELPKPLYPPIGEASKYLTISRATEGIMQGLFQSLNKTLDDQLKETLSDETELELHNIIIAGGRRGIYINPNSAPAHYNLGVALHNKMYLIKEREAAKRLSDKTISEFSKATELQENREEYHYNLASALYNKSILIEDSFPKEALELMDEAVAQFERALKINPLEMTSYDRMFAVKLHQYQRRKDALSQSL